MLQPLVAATRNLEPNEACLYSCPKSQRAVTVHTTDLHSARPASWLRLVMTTASSRGRKEGRGGIRLS